MNNRLKNGLSRWHFNMNFSIPLLHGIEHVSTVAVLTSTHFYRSKSFRLKTCGSCSSIYTYLHHIVNWWHAHKWFMFISLSCVQPVTWGQISMMSFPSLIVCIKNKTLCRGLVQLRSYSTIFGKRKGRSPRRKNADTMSWVKSLTWKNFSFYQFIPSSRFLSYFLGSLTFNQIITHNTKVAVE